MKLAEDTGAALAWIPRRAGERGALDAGALAGLLPGGRPLADTKARAEVAAAWGIDAADLPDETGLSTDGIITALLTPPQFEESAPDSEEDDALITAETAVESAPTAEETSDDAADAAAEDANLEAIADEPEPRISGLVVVALKSMTYRVRTPSVRR